MSGRSRRVSTALILITVLIVGLTGTPAVRAQDGGICDLDPRTDIRATPTPFAIIRAVSSTALDWVHETLNRVEDGFVWVRAFVRTLAGRAHV